MLTLKEAMWHYLIKRGSVIESESYYGDLINYDVELEYKDLDITRCSEIEDGYSDEFNGTFVEASQIEYLKGTAVTTEGKTYMIKFSMDDHWSFSECMQTILEILQQEEY